MAIISYFDSLNIHCQLSVLILLNFSMSCVFLLFILPQYSTIATCPSAASIDSLLSASISNGLYCKKIVDLKIMYEVFHVTFFILTISPPIAVSRTKTKVMISIIWILSPNSPTLISNCSPSSQPAISAKHSYFFYSISVKLIITCFVKLDQILWH